MTPRMMVLLGFLLMAVSPVRAALPDGLALDAELGVGHDSNVNREPTDARDRGSYVPYDLSMDYTRPFNPRWRAQARIHAWGGLYGGTSDTGDLRLLDARVSVRRRFEIAESFARRLDLELKGILGSKDKTFFSRTAGEEYFVDLGDSTVSLGDRYDSHYRRAAAAADLRGRHWALSTGLVLTRRDYLQDYGSVPDVDRLDYDAWRWEIGFTRHLSHHLSGELTHVRAAMDYDAWTARDVDGNRMPGNTQHFDYSSIEGALRYRLRGTGSLRLALEGKTRRDPFQGYYDYDQTSFEARLKLESLPRLLVDLGYGYSHRDYPRARVLFNPARPLRNDLIREVELRVESPVSAHGAIVVELAHENVDDAYPKYAFDRTRAWLGYHLTY